jgi:hypothetical protein
MSLRNKSFVLALFAVSCLFTAAVSAQTMASGTVVGQVTDQQNAIVPAAEVKLLDPSTNSVQTTLTNDAGRYIFASVAPGVYNVTVTKSGFTTAKISAQQVQVGLTLTVNASLAVGATTTTVEVMATAGGELQTTNATVGQTITGVQLAALPSLGRDANALFVLQPGVAPGGQVSGAVSDQNLYQLDGGNNSSDMDGNYSVYTNASGNTAGGAGGTPSGVMPTPIESVEEFKVGTNNQTADFNGSAGGQIAMVTKRGTNQFHGSAYDYYFSSNVGAANFWRNNHTLVNGAATPVPISHQNRFGASLGGQMIPKSILGGKTYFFFDYEARRYPQVESFERNVPTPLMRLGVIQVLNSSNQFVAYNLNPSPVTYNGVTYAPAVCPAGSCDPRGLGLNPIVSQIWNKYMPQPNDFTAGDKVNTQGYLGQLPIPLRSNFMVARIDHDFGVRNRFFASYRYYKFQQLADVQTDMGGALEGDTFGQYSAKAVRPQQPSYWVAGLTSTIKPTVTNDFRFSYLRNFWQWSTVSAPVQPIPGLGGSIEIDTDNSNALVPYNINAQNARQRFWDGQDKMIKDDVSWIKGNHLVQVGGTYLRNYDYHLRNDNGVGIMNSVVYQIRDGSGVNIPTQFIPTSIPSNQISNYNRLYDDILGIVSQPQFLYTRAGSNLTLQPPGSFMFDQSIIPYYSAYFSDTWRIKPTFTLTYGTSYQIEVPPYEINGKQVMLVDGSGKPIDIQSYLANRQSAALAGNTKDPNFTPQLGFATVRNIGGGNGLKYPFDTYYGGISPRAAAAWNPHPSGGLLGKLLGDGKTVIRGGYSRIYGRLNGVNLVLVPLLGTGLGQAVSCIGAVRTPVNGTSCLGPAGADPNTAFRIGTDGLVAPLPSVGQTLPQPYTPGGTNAGAGDGSGLDPKLKPNRSDQFDVTIQRELSKRVSFEVGYIGRILRNEFQETNVDAVPWMTTVNGQSFAQAFANTYFALASGAAPSAVPVQPFFEAALGGANSATCTGSGSCTAFIANNQKANISTTKVYSMWSAMSKLASWSLGRTMPSTAFNGGNNQLSSYELINSTGWSNYNGTFFSLRLRDFKGLSAVSNFTWSRALGTGAVTQSTSSYTPLNPWDLHSMYGTQPFDIRFVYNLSIYWNSSSIVHGGGLMKQIFGGWTIAPLFTAQSGGPLAVGITGSGGTNCESFGEINCSSGGTSTHENAPLISPYTGGNSAHYNVTVASGAGLTGNASTGGSGMNIFADPNAVYNNFRRLILGYDTNGGGNGVLRGFPTWNLDAQVTKEFGWKEHVKAQITIAVTNVLNHFQPTTPGLNLDTPASFGVITNQSNTPRQMEFGLRLHF